MNKPAPKEPSMDEILSSIRQIIADDDAAGVPRRPTIQAAPPPMQAAPARGVADPLDRDLSDMLDDIEPLALSPNQIVPEAAAEDDDVAGFSFDSILADTESAEEEAPVAFAPELVDPEDIGFSIEEADDGLPSFDPPPMRQIDPTPAPVAPVQRAAPPAPAPQPEPEPVRAAAPPPRPQPTIAQAAPMPDPTLSSDIAEQLLEPATQSAVRSSMTKLNGLGLGNTGATIESLMRDMLRPMLKEWLDENLPSVVERMVEKEISRISRGD
jgi:cell pole-organizing protein PopZ